MPNITTNHAITYTYHEWYFEIVIRYFTSRLASEIWDNSEISQVVFMRNITTNHAIICLYYFPKRFVIFTCRYFKLSWNTTALSQSNCRNFLCSWIIYPTHLDAIKTASFGEEGGWIMTQETWVEEGLPKFSLVKRPKELHVITFIFKYELEECVVL